MPEAPLFYKLHHRLQTHQLNIMTSNRQYDLVLLGVTGYTGRFCAEHIVQHLPTDLKWAIAGRSAEKLESIAQELKGLNRDRVNPGT